MSLRTVIAGTLLGGMTLPCGHAAAQVAALSPSAPPIELIDPEERISGNAATGIVLFGEDDTMGRNNLWAFLSAPVPSSLKLVISSIDGRYYAEVSYETNGRESGWIALDLQLARFSFLGNYDNPLSEVAVLLGDADEARFYPVRWGPDHLVDPPQAPPPLRAEDMLRVYVNTERARAFMLADGSPSYCREASAVSAFKFNAICDVSLGAVSTAQPGQDHHSSVDSIEIHRRSGTRSLAPITLDVPIAY